MSKIHVPNMKGDRVVLTRDDGVDYFISKTRSYHIFGKHVAISLNNLSAEDHFPPHFHDDGFFSFIIRGGYVEEISKQKTTGYKERNHPLFSLRWLQADTFHRVIKVKPNTWTICVFLLRKISKDTNPIPPKLNAPMVKSKIG